MAELVPATPTPMPGQSVVSPYGSPLGQFGAALSHPMMRRMIPWFSAAAAIGLLALTWSVMVPAPQRILYSSLEDGERAEVAAALDTASIAYRIDPGTGAVTVGEDELYRARMVVASQGALATPESGASMIDSLPMGASRTLEGDRLRAAQERELQLTIMEIDGVSAARVHLARAEKSVFVRESSTPTASVMLRLVRGKSLTNDQVTAIANLVAASVPNLAPESVRIVDQHGRLLSDLRGREADGLALQERTEAKLRTQISQLLTPIVGEGRFSSEVQVELDMDEQTSARETYDKEGVVRSETVSESSRSGTQITASGVPGATSNLPPVDPEAEQRAPLGSGASPMPMPEQESDGASNATRTYEVGREVAVTSSIPGRLQRMSIAVAIDAAALEGSPDEEIQKLEELIASAVGSDPERGDKVTVMARQFQVEEFVEPQFWETPWFATILRNVIALLSVILVLFLGVRPIQKILSRKFAPSSATPAKSAADGNENDSGKAVILTPNEATDVDEAPGDLRKQVELARRITREQPDDALHALRRMLREGSSEARQADEA